MPAVKATCLETGLTEGKICSVCGEILQEQAVVPVTEHDFVATTIWEPTCLEDGYGVYRCKYCEESYSITFVALGHEYEDGVCIRCDELDPYYSEGLSFTLSSDGTHYSVSGIGSCTDKDLVIPNEYEGKPVTAIKMNAFSDVTSIESVRFQLPSAMEEIPYGAFSGCTSLKRALLPETITEIGRYAFASCPNLESVNLPEGIKDILYAAFYDCGSLQGVVLPSALRSIGSFAFAACESLENITIPNGVTFIGEHAFYGCLNLKNVIIPASVTELGNGAFAGCETIEAFLVNPENENYVSVNGVIFTKDLKTLVLYPAGNESSSYLIPEGVTKVAADAFSACLHLESVTLPSTLTEIGDNAFSYCFSLKSILVDEASESFTSLDGVLFTKDETGLVCYPAGREQAEYTIPSTVIEVKHNAFEGAKNLTKLTIPTSVKSISSYAFNDCIALEKVKFGGIKTEWKEIVINTEGDANDALLNAEIEYTYPEYTKGLTFTLSADETYYIVSGVNEEFDSTEVVIPAVINENPAENEDIPVLEIAKQAFYEHSEITSVSLPEGLKTIGNRSFTRCTSLTSLTIPSSVTLIDEAAFYECAPLEEIIFAEGSLLETIGGYAFERSGIKSFTIPESVTTLERYAFSYCTALETIKIPAAVTTIGMGVFSNCSSLKAVTFDENCALDSISAREFYKNAALTDFVIPEGVTSIGERAFTSCTSLTSIAIPVSVTSIGEAAFFGCSSLESVVYGGSQANWNEISIASANAPLKNAEKTYTNEN